MEETFTRRGLVSQTWNMSGDLTNSITALTASSLASLRVNASSPANVARYLTRNE